MSVLTRAAQPGVSASDLPRRSRLIGRRVVLSAIVPILILLVWWLGSLSPTKGLFIASPLATVVRTFQDFLGGNASHLFLGTVAWQDLLPSLWRATVGFWLALVVGVVVGTALGVKPVVAALFQPLVHLGRSLPTPALLGVFFLLFGTGDWPKVLLIAFGVIWPILFNTIDGVQGIGTGRAHVAEVFKLRRRDVLFRILLPGAAPKIFAGARVALSLSLIMMIISELQKSRNGLGYLLVATQRNFDYPGFWSVLLVLALIGIILNIIIVRIERRVLAWHQGATSQHD
ncbi:ABC transporter permease [Leekyejoonella antrihumi]|uniref:ABC transporter permease n=1 Tax=Leekyejoonella antrihumi TaxID=1660198 RepID=UPI001FE4B48C|nr:ABC transporter permease subunit [Leekyejoonella antrihumi]